MGLERCVELFFGLMQLMEKQQVIGARVVDGSYKIFNAVSISLQQIFIVLQ